MRVLLEGVEARVPGRDAPLFSLARFEVPAGGRVLLEGPSGMGKSTLLHLIAGQFPPHRGRVTIGHYVLSDLDGEARARVRRLHIGILFQRFNLLGHLTALENVFLGARGSRARPPLPGAIRRERAETALRRLGVGHLGHELAAGFSVGEAQRVAVARLLCDPPDLLLADEPTSGLDAGNAGDVMDALEEAAGAGTLLVVSHDPRIRDRFPDARDFARLGAP